MLGKAARAANLALALGYITAAEKIAAVKKRRLVVASLRSAGEPVVEIGIDAAFARFGKPDHCEQSYHWDVTENGRAKCGADMTLIDLVIAFGVVVGSFLLILGAFGRP